MYKIVLSNRFKKDLKTAQKRDMNLSLLKRVVDILASGEHLEAKYHDHDLEGDY